MGSGRFVTRCRLRRWSKNFFSRWRLTLTALLALTYLVALEPQALAAQHRPGGGGSGDPITNYGIPQPPAPPRGGASRR